MCVYAYMCMCVCVTLDSTVTGYTKGFTPAASLPYKIIRYRKSENNNKKDHYNVNLTVTKQIN